jgi:hypothetical protein
MSIVVDIVDTFPTHDTLAVGRLKLHDLLIVSSIMLKIDDTTGRYYVEFPTNEEGQALVVLSDKILKEKVHDAMVYKYEQYILSLNSSSISNPLPYIYELERERIERNKRRYTSLEI